MFLLTYRLLNGDCRKRVWVVAMSKIMLCQCGCWGRHSFDAIFAVLRWSFLALIAGQRVDSKSVLNVKQLCPAAEAGADCVRMEPKSRARFENLLPFS